MALGFVANATMAIDWVGGGADNKTTTLANWSIGGETPSELPDLKGGTLDVTIKSGTGMIYADGDKFNTITNGYAFTNVGETVTSPFYIEPATADAALYLENGFTSDAKRQIVIKGRITHEGATVPQFWYRPFNVGYPSEKQIPIVPGIINEQFASPSRAWSAPLVFDGATLDMELRLEIMNMVTGFLTYTNSENLVTGGIPITGAQNGLSMMKGSKITTKKGISSSVYFHLMGDGELLVEDDTGTMKTLTGGLTIESGAKLTLATGPHMFDVTGNSTREGLLMWRGTVEFQVDNALTETTQFSIDNAASKNIVEFNSTTQRIGRVQFVNIHADSYLRGDPGSMLEISGETRVGTKDNPVSALRLKEPMCKVQIKGALSIHMMSISNDVFRLYDKAFESCGDLIVSRGTNFLDSSATWLNGTNFIAKGEGVMKFAKAGQVNRNFAEAHFGGNGRFYIPSGVTLEVKHAVLDDEGGRLVLEGTYDDTSIGDMAGKVIGGGSLKVLCSSRDTRKYVEINEDMTANGDTTNLVINAGCTNVIVVAQSGTGRIVKRGSGTLILRATSSFTGGIDIWEGVVIAEENDCLGFGEVTIRGSVDREDGYVGPCELRFNSVDKTYGSPTSNGKPSIHVVGQNTVRYPAVGLHCATNNFYGNIVADYDFYLMDDSQWLYNWFKAQKGSAKWSEDVKVTQIMHYYGDISVAGLMHLLPDGKHRFYGSVHAGTFETIYNGDVAYRERTGTLETDSYADLEFYNRNDFNRLVVGARSIYLYGTNSMGGAELVCDYSRPNGVSCNFYAYGGGTQVLASTSLRWSDYDTANRFEGPLSSTLVVTGTTANAECLSYLRLASGAGLCLDADPTYTLTMSGRVHQTYGNVDVNSGILRLARDTHFQYAPKLTVGEHGKLIIDTIGTNAFNAVTALAVYGKVQVNDGASLLKEGQKLTSLDISRNAELNLGLSQLAVTKLYIDGGLVPAGNWTHEQVPSIPVGMTITSTDGGIPTAEVTATWTGVIDSNMSKPGNWLVDDAVPASIDLTSGKTAVVIGNEGTEMIPDLDYVRVNSITSQRDADDAVPPFILGGYGRKLYVDGKVNSNQKCQLRVRGTIAPPFDVDQGDYGNNGNGNYTFYYYNAVIAKTAAHTNYFYGNNTAAAPLVLDNATISKPLYYHTGALGGDGICGYPHTTNVLAGVSSSGSGGWHQAFAGEGCLVEASGKFSFRQRVVRCGKGTLRFSGSSTSGTSGMNISDGTTVLANTNVSFLVGGGSNNRGIRVGGGVLQFACSYALKDNDQEQIDSIGSAKSIIDFGCTTQRISRFYANSASASSYLTGVYPAMVEVKGGTKWTSKNSDCILTTMGVNEQVKGGLGIHYLGNGPASETLSVPAGADDTFVISNQTFESCGDLAVSAGTLELAANAKWLNGTNFTARGTGKLKFNAAGQVGGEIAVFHFADTGKVEIPAGVTLRISAAEVGGEAVENGVYTKDSTGLMADRITGEGTLRIGAKGTTLILF